ncbi:hypothetical protein DCC81_10520 [Chitinophaga parva]|uniref:Uncharacterized protein n=1 Tax=Chitinophaga parva TaxID=2169414 RepID=A0A2T7BEQ5_9BACT|nr:hypothetical protein DCC81_10520 [Chitinophaga parva]
MQSTHTLLLPFPRTSCQCAYGPIVSTTYPHARPAGMPAEYIHSPAPVFVKSIVNHKASVYA